MIGSGFYLRGEGRHGGSWSKGRSRWDTQFIQEITARGMNPFGRIGLNVL